MAPKHLRAGTAQATSLLALIDPARMRFSFIGSRFALRFQPALGQPHALALRVVRCGQFTAQNPFMCRIASARLALTPKADHNILCGPATYRLSWRRRPLREKRVAMPKTSVQYRFPGQVPDFACGTTLKHGFTVVKPCGYRRFASSSDTDVGIVTSSPVSSSRALRPYASHLAEAHRAGAALHRNCGPRSLDKRSLP